MKLVAAVGVATVCVLVVAGVAAQQRGEEFNKVETMAQARAQYYDCLQALVEYYDHAGNKFQMTRAMKELQSFEEMEKYDYITVVEQVSFPTSMETVLEANNLFDEARQLQMAFDIVSKKAKLNVALGKYKQILRKFPASDKVPQVCYYIGQIYEGPYFQDYPIAAKYYEKSFELDPNSKLQAGFHAAKIYYRNLKDYGNAIRLCNAVVQDSGSDAERRLCQQYLDELREYGFIGE